MTQRSTIGALGESIACRYIEEKGFVVVERNYWKPQGEIDIVAKKEKNLHFIEVKTVSWDFLRKEIGERGIGPEENLHKNKLTRLFRAIQIYLMERRIPEDAPWQVDATFVFLDQKHKKSKVEYYEHISLE